MDYQDRDPPPPAPEPQPRAFRAGLALGCLGPTVAACLIGGVLLYIAGDFLGLDDDDAITDMLAPIVAWVLVALVILGAHGSTIYWTRQHHPRRREAVLVHAPFPPAYLAALAWWHLGDWSAGYILWGLAVLVALAWVLVWWLRRPSEPRRALAALGAVLVLVGGSGLGIAAIMYEETNGFGWKGEATPWGALAALGAASCHAEDDYYINRHKTQRADCPTVPDAYNGDYDTALFDRLICNDQPKQAFQRFWDWNKEYRLLFNLKIDIENIVVDRIPTLAPYPPEIKGKHATITAEMVVQAAFHIPDYEQEWTVRVEPGGGKETWNVDLEWASAGGWKVCGIDIENPIDPTFEPE